MVNTNIIKLNIMTNVIVLKFVFEGCSKDDLSKQLSIYTYIYCYFILVESFHLI